MYMPCQLQAIRPLSLCLCVWLGLFLALGLTRSARTAGPVAAPPVPTTNVATFARLPLRFEANQGQAAKPIKFLARGPAAQLALTAQQAMLQVGKQSLKLRWPGAQQAARVEGLELLPERSHYLRGPDPRQWQTNIQRYARVRYNLLYPGIDLIFYDHAQQLEYDFVIAPGYDARRIALQFDGQHSLQLNAAGELLLQLGDRLTVKQHAPCAYQQTAQGRVFVDVRYRLLSRGRIGFTVGRYDRRLPLVIDPVLEYASLIGGSGSDEAFAMRQDTAGNTYLAGQTTSLDLPGAGAIQAVPGGATDAFVAKVNAAGTALVFATYLGGSALDYATALALDAPGNVHITGATYSNDFPLTSGNLPNMNRGYADTFVAKLSTDGSQLVYSTTLGGNGIDIAYGVAVNSTGQAIIAGRSDSADLPNALRLGQPLYRSNDQAANWVASATGLTAYQTNALAASRTSPNLVYAGTSQGVYTSIDGGAQWQVAGARGAYCYALAVDPHNAQTSYLGTANGLYKSVDGGAIYESVSVYNFANQFRPVYHLAFDGGQPAALYVGAATGLSKSSNGGASFTPLPISPAQQALRVNRIALEPGMSQTLYVATPLGVLKSTNGGTSWALLPLTPRTAFNYFGAEAYTVAVDPQVPRTLYAGVSGSNGGVLKSTDGGATWVAINRGLTVLPGNQATVLAAHHLSIDPLAPATLYAASYAGGLFRSTDGGTNWNLTVNGLRNLLVQALHVDDAGKLWAGTIAGSDILLAHLNQSGGVIALRLLGGSENDEARALELDQSGNLYLTGRTFSLNFPTRNPWQAVNRTFSTVQPTADAFVTKLNPAGTEVLYSTYLGGNDTEQGSVLALNAAGNVTVGGTTTSTDFPTTPGVIKAVKGDFNQDVFVTSFNATGTALQFSTYLGGVAEELLGGLALDARGQVYVTGSTRSADFPLANPLPVQINQFFFRKAFVAKLTSDATTILFSTLMGGNSQEIGNGIAVDSQRNVYVGGSTSSNDFPVLNPLPGNSFPFSVNAFLARFAPQADLAISSTTQANPVQAGQNYRYAITVTNLGPDEAVGVMLNDTIPDGLANAAISASTGANACTGAPNFQCRLGELPVGASVTITLTGNAPTSGTLNQTASVTSETTDAVSTNNRATLTTAITNLPSLAGRITLPNGAPLAGVTLTLSEGQTVTKQSDLNGAYQFATLAAGGNYTITAARTGYVLRPASLRFANLQTDQRADFIATVCTFTLATNQRAFTANGGTGTLNIVTNDAACAWQVRSNAPWLMLGSNSTGNGNGTLTFTVAPASDTRSGTLSLGSQLVTITQEVQACATPSVRVAPSFGVATAGSELTEGDFNGDGLTDLVWFNTPPNEASVWLGNGQGGFSTTPRHASFGLSPPFTLGAFNATMAAGDLNNDGRSDLVALTYNPAELITVLSNADGTFSAPRKTPAPGNSNSFTLAQLNNDNRLDAIILTYNPGGLHVLLGNSDGSFGTAITTASNTGSGAVRTGDFNRDGKTDILVVDSSDLYLHLGDGTGKVASSRTFIVGGFVRTGSAVTDFDRDGNLDLALASSGDSFSYSIQLWRGNGMGGFNGPVYYRGLLESQQLLARDVNNDGYPDLIAASTGTTVSVLINNPGGGPTGGFYPAVPYHAGSLLSGMATGDFNRDGQLDVALPVRQPRTNNQAARIALLTTSGNEWLAARVNLLPASNRLAATGDFNNDGRTDIVLRTDSALTLQLGNGANGFLNPLTVPPGIISSTFTTRDVNRDGNLDLLAENRYSLYIWLGDGTGRLFAPRAVEIAPPPTSQGNQTALTFPAPLAWADFNRDGREDLATITPDRQPVLLFANADGTFSAPQPFGAGSNMNRLLAGDFNGDGRADLVGYTQNPGQCGTDGTQVTFFPGTENVPLGAPVRSLLETTPAQLLAEDFNGDGRTELLFFGGCNVQVPVGLATLNAQGGFTVSNRMLLASQPSALAYSDLNYDGRKDVVLALPDYDQTNQGVVATLAVMIARPEGGFNAPITLVESHTFNALALGDFNADGRTDVITSSSSFSSLSVLTIFNNRCFTARPLALVSAASYRNAQFAPAAIVAAFGPELATATATARAIPLPELLVGTRLNVIDTLGNQRTAGLYFVSPNQVNFQMPTGLAPGLAQVTITNGNGATTGTTVRIIPTAPGLFAANANGQGVPAAYLLRVRADGTQVTEPVARLDSTTNRFVPVPIEFGATSEQLYLVLFGTGLRGHSGLEAVKLKLGGLEAPILFAGAQGDLIGLDQINATLPRALQGRGEIEVQLIVDGQPANPLRLNFR